MTVSQYLKTGRTDCRFDDPAEGKAILYLHSILIMLVLCSADDFDNTVLHTSFPPSQSQLETITVNVGIHVDNVVETEEVFVVLLEIAGVSTATITRGCTVIRILERFIGQCKHYTPNYISLVWCS